MGDERDTTYVNGKKTKQNKKTNDNLNDIMKRKHCRIEW